MKHQYHSRFAGAAVALLLAVSIAAADSSAINTAPEVTIVTPRDGSFFMIDRGIALVAEAYDREDAADDLAYQWTVEQMRGDRVERVLHTANTAATSFVVESLPSSSGVTLRARVVVTDSGDLTDTATVLILPRSDASPAYPLGPGDVLEVSVYAGGEKQEAFSAEVTSDGRVTAPLLGDIEVMGLTAAQVAEKLTFLLERDYFVDPQVLVSMKDQVKKVYISGEVRSPGAYTIPEGSTVLNACILAGGFTDYAQLKRVTVSRFDGKESQLITVDLSKVQAGKAEDLILRPGDRVDVPHRTF